MQYHLKRDLGPLKHPTEYINNDTSIAYIYPTTSLHSGLQVMNFWFERFPREISDEIEKRFINEGLNYIL